MLDYIVANILVLNEKIWRSPDAWMIAKIVYFAC